MVFDEYPGGMVGRAVVVAPWLLVEPLGESPPQLVISSGKALVVRQASAIAYLVLMDNPLVGERVRLSRYGVADRPIPTELTGLCFRGRIHPRRLQQNRRQKEAGE